MGGKGCRSTRRTFFFLFLPPSVLPPPPRPLFEDLKPLTSSSRIMEGGSFFLPHPWLCWAVDSEGAACGSAGMGGAKTTAVAEMVAEEEDGSA